MDGDAFSSTGAPAVGTRSADGDLAQQLAELVDELQQDPSHQAVLDRTAAAAVELVPGAQHAGVCLVRAGRRVGPASATSELVLRLDELQADTGEGPCWDAALHQRAARVADVGAEVERWPELASRARALGTLSVLCLHVRSGKRGLGALKLLSEEPGAFDAEAERVAALLAVHAGRAIADAHQLENLQLGLAHRDVIGQAKGILMERHRITADQAFALLASASQHTNRKLHDVAVDLTASGELPQR
ncbi:GAF and ANTAR domain-containing protein [Quadrisphaera setariae]|uniref:GAF and ANTAR domain-containing protein n=1 Tax=Quadrisphaera setariae TaxID=2593304 RepID=A0A5C8ZJ93_9ACTN|nr:GAF and ANTAR domain-containing protein [Quadrisphaera setariae]TXR57193.1 GAF and ANTAR domain-containing protein [Quadrisphaera setariae]